LQATTEFDATLSADIDDRLANLTNTIIRIHVSTTARFRQLP